MGFFPFACRILVCFRHGGINMNGSQDFVEPQPMFYGKNIFCDNIPRMGADNGDTQNFIRAWFCQHFDIAVVLGIGNRPIQVIDVILGKFVSNSLSPTLATSGSV